MVMTDFDRIFIIKESKINVKQSKISTLHENKSENLVIFT